jgi:hypothetical protein
MLKAINTKLLISILAALAIIAGLLVRLEQANERAAAAEAKVAQVLQEEQRQAEEQKKQEAEFRRQLAEAQKKSHSFAGNESKTWQTYVP